MPRRTDGDHNTFPTALQVVVPPPMVSCSAARLCTTEGSPMKLRTPLAIAALTVTGIVVGVSSPASAADTNTTFSLTSGDLSITVGATAALTDATTGTTTISGNLGTVAVTDERGGTANWNVSAASTAFSGAIVGGSSSTAVSYTAGVVTETGTVTVADGTATALSTTAASVVAPTSLSGNNTASWNPVLDVTMPAGALADTYSGVVTTSIL